LTALPKSIPGIGWLACVKDPDGNLLGLNAARRGGPRAGSRPNQRRLARRPAADIHRF
jgi:hypothetical protein